MITLKVGRRCHYVFPVIHYYISDVDVPSQPVAKCSRSNQTVIYIVSRLLWILIPLGCRSRSRFGWLKECNIMVRINLLFWNVIQCNTARLDLIRALYDPIKWTESRPSLNLNGTISSASPILRINVFRDGRGLKKFKREEIYFVLLFNYFGK